MSTATPRTMPELKLPPKNWPPETAAELAAGLPFIHDNLLRACRLVVQQAVLFPNRGIELSSKMQGEAVAVERWQEWLCLRPESGEPGAHDFSGLEIKLDMPASPRRELSLQRQLCRGEEPDLPLDSPTRLRAELRRTESARVDFLLTKYAPPDELKDGFLDHEIELGGVHSEARFCIGGSIATSDRVLPDMAWGVVGSSNSIDSVRPYDSKFFPLLEQGRFHNGVNWPARPRSFLTPQAQTFCEPAGTQALYGMQLDSALQTLRVITDVNTGEQATRASI